MGKKSLRNASRPQRAHWNPRSIRGKGLRYAIGQDPEHGDGVGRLSCIDAKNGEVVWKYTDVGRTISTVSVHDDLVDAAEYAGLIHCLDANDGKLYWTYDSFSRIWVNLCGGW